MPTGRARIGHFGHGFDIYFEGHKGVCKYRECTCNSCSLVTLRKDVNEVQDILKRYNPNVSCNFFDQFVEVHRALDENKNFIDGNCELFLSEHKLRDFCLKLV